MKIIVTGASGSIGSALVPYLLGRGHELLLVGRNAGGLRESFPDCQAVDYTELPKAAGGYDVCVHLAVKNNDDAKNHGGDLENFRAVNVALMQEVFGNIQKAGVGHFINITSFHAANPSQMDPYAVSKREADQWLAKQAGMKVTALRLPAVSSGQASGNLGIVNKLPRFLRPMALSLLGAIKPIIGIGLVLDTIVNAAEKRVAGEIEIANPAERNLVFAGFKKPVDWGFALSVILLFWWLFAIVFIAIKVTSPGPAIFAQTRVGRHGQEFTCYKFRTMRTGTKQAGTHDVGADAITGVGAFLRRTKIDELPQVINILRGELSLVGPRPCLPVQSKLVAEREKRAVLTVLPGITGWAQINDIDMSDPVRLARADAHYLARRSIPFELLIILRTFTGAGRGDRVKPVS